VKPDYPGTVEVVPGVFIAFDDHCPAIYVADERGEIVTWNYDEMEDPSAWTASLMAVILAAKLGTAANRAVLDEKQNPLDLLAPPAPAPLTIVDFLSKRTICATRASARRLVVNRMVKVNGALVTDFTHFLSLGDRVVVGLGKVPFDVTEEDF
jgi:hypothetical protein